MTPEARLRQRIRFPVLALTAVAWAGLVVVGMPHAPGAHETAEQLPTLVAAGVGIAHPHVWGATDHDPGSWIALGVSTGLMLVAMMAPLLIPAVRHVIDRSLPARRARSVGLLVVGYAGAWAVAWLALVVVASLIRDRLGPDEALAAGLLVAGLWQASPTKRRCLRRCHGRPALAAFGRAADRDALRFGVRQARWCIGSCWALMLLPLLVPGHGLVAMAAVALWMWAERFEHPSAAGWGFRVPTRAVRIGVRQLLVASRRLGVGRGSGVDEPRATIPA